jgi:hypothetical protein
MSWPCLAKCACRKVDRTEPLSDPEIAVLQVLSHVFSREGIHAVDAQAALQKALCGLDPSLWAHVLSLPVASGSGWTVLGVSVMSIRMLGLLEWLLCHGVCVSIGLVSVGAWDPRVPRRRPLLRPEATFAPFALTGHRHMERLLRLAGIQLGPRRHTYGFSCNSGVDGTAAPRDDMQCSCSAVEQCPCRQKYQAVRFVLKRPYTCTTILI